MLTSVELLGDSVRAGVVSGSAVLRGEVLVRPLPRSNSVHGIESGGEPVMFTKQAGLAAHLDGDDPVAAELSTCSLLAPSGLAPRLHPASDAAVAWIHPVPGRSVVGVAEDPEELDRIAACLGACLARLHTQPCDEGSPPTALAPWPLRLALPPSMQSTELTCESCDQARSAVLAVIRLDAVVAIVRRLRADWGPRVWTHGDVSLANLLIDTSPDDGAIRMIDWESAGLGNPAWDLVSAEAALGLLDGRRERSKPPSDDEGTPISVAFHRAYRRAGGTATVSPAWRCVRELVSAWQFTSHDTPQQIQSVHRALESAQAHAAFAREETAR